MNECPDEDEGPFHFWEVDGPFTVYCDNCGVEGRIVLVEDGG